MELQEWRAAAASVIGTSHERTQQPCQDWHAFELIEGKEQVAVLIASDGAGSASRSDHGSRLASRELLDNIRLYLGEGGTLAELTRETAFDWLTNVADAISHEATREELSSREYACTLLAALVSPTHAAYLQVGDGAIVVRSGSDEWSWVFWPQHGEYINTTVFITDPKALSAFEFDTHAGAINEVAAFTDGIEALVLHYATQSVHGPFFDRMFPAIRRAAEPGLDVHLSAHLAAYLGSESVCSRTDDDKTLLLASRLKRPPSRALVPIEPLPT